MPNMRDAPVLKAVADVVKEHVGKAFANLRDRIEKFDSRLKSIESELIVKALGPTTSDVVDIQVEKVATALVGRIDGLEQRFKGIETELIVTKLGPPAGDVIDFHIDKAATVLRGRIDAVEKRLEYLPAWYGKDLELPKGERGSSVHVGDGPPLFDALPGDSYIDAETGDIYRCIEDRV